MMKVVWSVPHASLESMVCGFSYSMISSLIQGGYDVHGTILVSGEANQLDWSVARFDNGKELYTHHIDDVRIDMDFWEVGARYAKQYWDENPPESIT